MGTKPWSKEEIKFALIAFYVKNKKTPRAYELRNKNMLPSMHTLLKVFNGMKYEEILNASGS